MEIKLSDSDIDRIVAQVEERLLKRATNKESLDALYEAMKERAQLIAKNIYGDYTLTGEIVDAVTKAITTRGVNYIENIAHRAVRAVHQDDPELQRLVRQAIFKEAQYAAEQAAQQLGYGIE